MFIFKVLKFNEYILIQLGIFSNRFPTKSLTNPFFKSPQTYYIMLFAILFITSSILFVYQHLAQFDATLRTCSIILECFQSFGMYLSFGLNSNKIRIVHIKLQELVDKSTEGMRR